MIVSYDTIIHNNGLNLIFFRSKTAPDAFVQCNPQQKKTLMKTEKQHFLNSYRLPTRLKAELTGWELGFEYHESPLLVKANLRLTL